MTETRVSYGSLEVPDGKNMTRVSMTTLEYATLREENLRLRVALERIAKFPHPTDAATGDAMKGYIEALNDVGAVAEQALQEGP